MPPAEELYQQTLALRAQVADLEAQVAWYRRQMFGQRSEKLVTDSPLQAKLGLPETPQAEREIRTVTYERRTPAAEKRPIPAEVFKDLPVAETIELLPAEVRAEPEAFERISEERTFEVDLIGPQLVKREIVRPKFRRKTDRSQAPVIAPALPRPALGGYAAAGLLPMSPSPNTNTICRCTAWRRCRPNGARRSVARAWPTGSGWSPTGPSRSTS